MHGVTFSSTQIWSLVSGKATAQHGLAKGPKTSQVLDQVCLAPWQRLSAPSFCQRAHDFFFLESPTLRVGHPTLGCNNHKANATITEVNLGSNNIGDRGAVALAGAVQALLATVFFVSSTHSVLDVL